MATIEYSHIQCCIFVVITKHDVVILIKLMLLYFLMLYLTDVAESNKLNVICYN